MLLTSPLETFSVGNTIVISRGLIDVLPDEASLAMVLSHELAHIVLGHNLGSKYAFDDRMLFSDESVFTDLGFRHVPEEEAAADKKAIEILKKSPGGGLPNGGKLDTAGLFLRQLSERGSALGALFTAHLGNGFVDGKGQLIRFNALAEAAPKLEPAKLDQIAALPLGGRIKMGVWNDDVQMVKTPPRPSPRPATRCRWKSLRSSRDSPASPSAAAQKTPLPPPTRPPATTELEVLKLRVAVSTSRNWERSQSPAFVFLSLETSTNLQSWVPHLSPLKGGTPPEATDFAD